MNDDDWGFRFLMDWLKENPQPMNEHGQMIGQLPDAFLRAFYVEDEMRRLRERLEAMPFSKLAGSAGKDFKNMLAQEGRIEQLRAAAQKSVVKRQSAALANNITRRYVDAKAQGVWTRESAGAMAVSLDCEPQYVRRVIKNFEEKSRDLK